MIKEKTVISEVTALSNESDNQFIDSHISK